MRAFKWNGPGAGVPRNGEGKLGCCCGGCPCPEGLSDTYCIPDPFTDGGMLAVGRIADCVWCGFSAGAEDERQRYNLAIEDDIDGSGACGWSLGIADGIVVLTKAWDDGNPVGTYVQGEISTTVSECGGAEEVRPCDETIPPCPCFDDLPSNVSASYLGSSPIALSKISSGPDEDCFYQGDDGRAPYLRVSISYNTENGQWDASVIQEGVGIIWDGSLAAGDCDNPFGSYGDGSLEIS